MTKVGIGDYGSGKIGESKWEGWLNTSSKTPQPAYVLLTRKCNSDPPCPHCYLEASPKRKEVMPMKLRKKVIEQVAENGIAHIKFSGGEVTILDDLADTLKYAKETYEKAGYSDFIIEVQTNANFLRGLDERRIEEELEKLKTSGANALDISSADTYHNIAVEELEKIGKCAKKVFGEYAIQVRGGTEPAAAIGERAKTMPRSKLAVGENAEFFTKTFNMYHRIDIDEKGDVFNCTWYTFSMGNINDTPLKDIIESAKKPGTLVRKLAERNGFAKLDPRKDLNISKEEFNELIEQWGECGGCKDYSERYHGTVRK